MTRRTILGGLGVANQLQQRAQAAEWKPRLGILAPFTESNVRFAKEEGFTNMILGGTRGSTMDANKVTDAQIDTVKQSLAKNQMYVSALQASQDHIAADPDKRKQDNDYFVKLIELAGKLGIPYIGTSSGKNVAKPYEQQVDDIVRVYTERYFPACQANKVRILWEPYPGGANIAINPFGFEALFKGFGDSPHVGLQYDPSHLVWQMMDPIQTARDFVDKIYDVHLKDTEVRWQILRKSGIHPLTNEQWWRYRLPGMGSIDWPAFFTVLMDAGYQGAMNIEHEDDLYGWRYRDDDFSEEYKTGFRVAHQFLRQFVQVVFVFDVHRS